MTAQHSFDDALDRALEALGSGVSREQVMATTRHAEPAMRELIDTAAMITPPPVPAPARLAEHYTIVRAAVERAQIAQREMMPREAQQVAWWKRRLGIASVSVPAGVALAFALAGAAGAAGGVALTGAGQEIAQSVRPGWVNDIVGGGAHDDETPDGVPRRDDENPAAPGSGDTPGSEHRPQAITLGGTVTNVRGNVFTLVSGDGEWLVQIDANTTVNGEILEGGTATVEGDITAERNLHATSLTVTGGTPADKPGNAPEDPGQPGEPGNQNEPNAAKTPGGGLPATPPGNSGEQERGGPSR